MNKIEGFSLLMRGSIDSKESKSWSFEEPPSIASVMAAFLSVADMLLGYAQ